jgi:hypothetical protein
MGWEKGSHIRSLDYRSRAQLTVMEAAALMAEAVPDGYNEFQAAVILELPDTARVEIAREGSVCLYVWNAGLAACRKLEADECHKQDDGSIRCWWD